MIHFLFFDEKLQIQLYFLEIMHLTRFMTYPFNRPPKYNPFNIKIPLEYNHFIRKSFKNTYYKHVFPKRRFLRK